MKAQVLNLRKKPQERHKRAICDDSEYHNNKPRPEQKKPCSR